MPSGVYIRGSSPEERFWSYVDKNGRENENIGKCWRWIGYKKENGYGRIMIGKRFVLAHRYSYAIHNPYGIELGDMDGCLVCHECDNCECTNPDHLFIGDNQDNMDDKCNKGRQWKPKGEKHGRSKLNQAEVIEIRNIYKNEEITQKQLAFEYGVTQGLIYQIINNKLWSHITTSAFCNQNGF